MITRLRESINMLKKMIALSSCTAILLSTTALAGNLSPKQLNSQQATGANSVSESHGSLTVFLQHVSSPQQVRVFHPNGAGKISETFSPYAYKNIINGDVFYLSIKNNGSGPVFAQNLNIHVSLNGMPANYLGKNEMSEIWRHYHYLNTNTITGAPNFMEQERAIRAEKYLDKHAFNPNDIPPGGEISGYIAVEKMADIGQLRFNISNLQPGLSMDSFAFAFNFNSKKM